ncbi:MAG: hypothetical protein LBS34_01700 [Rickettsiales bacterium]|nr:hypothetical protein [Rickettsiales bacterium]
MFTLFLTNNLDVFFTIIMMLLYIAFVFCAKNIISKFFIFFISSFINIFNYSVVLKNEYNFLTIVLLNVIFMLAVAFFYVHSNTDNKNLSSDFMEANDIKNFITITIFLISFVSLCFIFLSFNSKKEMFNKLFSNKIVADKTDNFRVDGLVQKKQELQINNQKYIIYTRNINFIENSNIFLNYNLIIIFYIAVSIIGFFITSGIKENEG